MNDVSKRVQEMAKALSQRSKEPGGLNTLIQMLGQVDRETERNILQALDRQNPLLAKELREQYFAFEDLMQMEDRVLQRALQDVHRSTLALALKGTPEALQDKVFRNLSKHAAEMVREEIQALGSRSKILVDEAQREVTKELRRWKNVIV